jgi:hypothetical protein
LIANVAIEWHRDEIEARRAVGRRADPGRIANRDELLRVTDGKRTHDNGIDEREDGGVCTDAERQSHDDDET